MIHGCIEHSVSNQNNLGTFHPKPVRHMKIKKILKCMVPRKIIDYFRAPWNSYKEFTFQRQETRSIRIFDRLLDVPEHHPIDVLMAESPCRDLNVGIVAKYAACKYPDKSIIDIGANVGDTAAVIAHHCPNRLILVEGSDFYIKYLMVNAPRLGNEFEIHKVFLNDGNPMKGTLQHWGGTAVFAITDQGPVTETIRLGDLTKDSVCFVKSDTDGYDFGILTAGIEWIAAGKPALLYECQIGSAGELDAAVLLTSRLRDAGYAHFIVWDASGNHMLSTSDTGQLDGIQRYLLKTSNAGRPGNMSNLDIACFHARDRDVYDAVNDWYVSH